MSRSAEERVFPFSCERLGSGLSETIVSSKAAPEILDTKCKSEFKHDFTNPEADARRCLVRKVFVNISQNSEQITCTRVSFLIKLKKLWRQCFLVHFTKFLGIPFFTEHLWWLLFLMGAIWTVLF